MLWRILDFCMTAFDALFFHFGIVTSPTIGKITVVSDPGASSEHGAPEAAEYNRKKNRKVPKSETKPQKSKSNNRTHVSVGTSTPTKSRTSRAC